MGSGLIEFARSLAEESGRLIRERFAAGDVEFDTKADDSMVTQTDRDVEKMLREMIHAIHPDHGIIGEELGSEGTDAEFVWTLDPIDGTISFVSGVPLFGTLIGLMQNGQPILGVIHQPVLGELMIGDGATTTHNGRETSIRPCNRLEDATLLTTDPNLADRFQDGAKFQALRRSTAMTRTWGDCYGYLMLASGRADIMLDPIMNQWDLIPLIPIIRGAGGVITDWHGGDPVNGNSIVAAGPDLHPQVLEMLR
jgi:histidinol phosphatase-like enzyme (inositol monophosphatase family)